jgi:hypothetical protein
MTRPRRVPSGARLEQLRGLLRERDVLSAAIEIEQELAARRLDQRLSRAGYPSERKRHWPRERMSAEATGQVLRRGPWIGPAWRSPITIR